MPGTDWTRSESVDPLDYFGLTRLVRRHLQAALAAKWELAPKEEPWERRSAIPG